MNPRDTLQLAARLAEHGVEIAQECNGISTASLRNYSRASQSLLRQWSEQLREHDRSDVLPTINEIRAWSDCIRPILEDISVGGVLFRVASTLLHSIGMRLDIPLAVDVANQTARAYSSVVHRAMASVTWRANIPEHDLARLDELGRVCDRLSDLLCGSLLPHLNCPLFAVDAGRASDYSQTFSRFPSLVRIPIRKALGLVEKTCTVAEQEVQQLESALEKCLPGLTQYPEEPRGGLSDLMQMFCPRTLPLPRGTRRISNTPAPSSGHKVTFPTFSFSSALAAKPSVAVVHPAARPRTKE